MKITEVEVHKFNKPDSKVLGIAVVVLDDCFKVRQIRIINGDNGPFIAMPSKPKPNGEFFDIAHPLNQETRAMFTEAILAKYREVEAESETTETEESE